MELWIDELGRRKSCWVSFEITGNQILFDVGFRADIFRALKIGGPEILREEYDAHVQSHLERGEIYRQRLAEEATTVSQLLAKSTESDSVDQDMGVVPPPQLSVGQSQAEVGIQIEHLLPGMAIGGELQRKRGWNVDLSVGDWSRVITT